MITMSTSPLISRYGELHRAELRAEVRRDRLAASCLSDMSAMRRTTSRLGIAFTARIAAALAKTEPMAHAAETRDPVTRGAL